MTTSISAMGYSIKITKGLEPETDTIAINDLQVFQGTLPLNHQMKCLLDNKEFQIEFKRVDPNSMVEVIQVYIFNPGEPLAEYSEVFDWEGRPTKLAPYIQPGTQKPKEQKKQSIEEQICMIVGLVVGVVVVRWLASLLRF